MSNEENIIGQTVWKEGVNLFSTITEEQSEKEKENILNQAIDKFRVAIEMNPNLHFVYCDWGEALVSLYELKPDKKHEYLLDEAITMLSELPCDDDTAFRTNQYLAWALGFKALLQKDKEREQLIQPTLDQFQKALRLKSDSYELLQEWGRFLGAFALEESEDQADSYFSQAYIKFRDALRLNPYYDKASQDWAWLMSEQAKRKPPKEARILYRRATEALMAVLYDQRNSETGMQINILYDLGCILLDWAKSSGVEEEKELLLKAEATFQTAYEICPRDASVLYQWGYIYLRRTLFLDADHTRLLKYTQGCFLRAEELQPGVGTYKIACLFARFGHFAISKRWLKKAKDYGKLPSLEEILSEKDLQELKESGWLSSFLAENGQTNEDRGMGGTLVEDKGTPKIPEVPGFGAISEAELEHQFQELFHLTDKFESKTQELHEEEEKKSFLEQFGRDLTAEARQGKLGSIVGRDQEILQVIQTLCMRKKNNPVLVGEAGVGKTAIGEALAVKAVNGEYKGVLAGKKIIELNMGILVSGAQYRGMFEERLTGIIEEVTNDPNIILFIDEIHMIVGVGDSDSNSNDAANIMKPALANGGIRCIGATTVQEYEKFIQRDPALERRFHKVLVKEPSLETTITILKSIRKVYEEKQLGIVIPDEVLNEIAELSVQYIPERHLPDKAIDILDKAVAHVFYPDEPCSFQEDKSTRRVTLETVKHIVREFTGTPIGFEGEGRKWFQNLRQAIRQKVIGHDHAVEKVVDHLILSHSDLRPQNRPLGVFLFLGPTGVGKTHLARVMAAELFGSTRKILRFGMGQYADESSISKLIGYTGMEAGGQLTEALRKNPYSLILLDEVEKAHQAVHDLLIRLFEDGSITDAKGRLVDARHALFVLTTDSPETGSGLGFNREGELGSLRGNTNRSVEKLLGREFVSQIDEIIVFDHLEIQHLTDIIHKMLEQISQDVQKEKNVSLSITDEVVNNLALQAYSRENGARDISRVLKRNVIVPLSRADFDGELTQFSRWCLICSNGGIELCRA